MRNIIPYKERNIDVLIDKRKNEREKKREKKEKETKLL